MTGSMKLLWSGSEMDTNLVPANCHNTTLSELALTTFPSSARENCVGVFFFGWQFVFHSGYDVLHITSAR